MSNQRSVRNNSVPFVSVVIPTYNDTTSLKKCLACMTLQTYPQDLYEVIVVNNNPEDVLDLNPEIKRFQLLTETKPGSYAARNLGVNHAIGEIIAFTDADCLPADNWLENGVKHLMNGAERVAGKVVFTFESDRLAPAEVYEKAFVFDQKRNVQRGCSVTANLFVWKNQFNQVGLFEDTLMSGGDIEWGMRAHKVGLGIVFGEDTIVRHPSRAMLSQIFKKTRRVSGGVVSAHTGDFWHNSLMLLVRGFTPPVRKIGKAFKNKELRFGQKVMAGCLAYVLKIYSTYHKLLIKFGITKPTRS